MGIFLAVYLLVVHLQRFCNTQSRLVTVMVSELVVPDRCPSANHMARGLDVHTMAVKY